MASLARDRDVIKLVEDFGQRHAARLLRVPDAVLRDRYFTALAKRELRAAKRASRAMSKAPH